MGTTEWTFLKTVHETRTACEATIPGTIDVRVRTYTMFGFDVIGRDAEADRRGLPHLFVGEREHGGKPVWGVQHYFYCYPSNFDPRGPKGR